MAASSDDIEGDINACLLQRRVKNFTLFHWNERIVVAVNDQHRSVIGRYIVERTCAPCLIFVFLNGSAK